MLKDFKVLSRFIHESNLLLVRITVCIESCLPIGWRTVIWYKKKSTKVQLYFGLDCGMIEFFTYKPQSKEQVISLPHCYKTFRRIPPPSPDDARLILLYRGKLLLYMGREFAPSGTEVFRNHRKFQAIFTMKREEEAWWDRTQYLWITIPVLYP